MREEIIVALCDAIVKKHLENNPIESIRGPRGIRGPKGDSGKDFSITDSEDLISSLISEQITDKLKQFKTECSSLSDEQISTLKLKFEDLSPYEVESLKGPRGKTGPIGKSFNFEKEKESITNIVESYISEISSKFKIKFKDLTEDEIKSIQGERGPKGLRGEKGASGPIGKSGKDGVDGKNGKDGERGPKGPRGQRGRDGADGAKGEIGEIGPIGPRGLRGEKGKAGQDFVLEQHKVEIDTVIIDYFEKIKNQLILKFEDLTVENKEELRLKYDSLTNEQKNELRGAKGSRGQRGSTGARGLSAFDVWKEINEGSEEDFLLSLIGPRGIDGLDGVNGKNGADGAKGKGGKDGQDGQDAPFVTDVIAKNFKNNDFTLEFEYSDGTLIKTNRIKLPVSSVVNQIMMGGGGGGGSSSLELTQDGVEVGEISTLDFDNDFIITYDSENKIASISADSRLTILDEGIVISDRVNKINFVGDGVYTRKNNSIANWENLTDINSLDEIIEDPSIVDVVIDSSAQNISKFTITKIASENILKNDLINLDSQTTVRKAVTDSYEEAVVAGISLNDALLGEDVTMIVFGLYEDPTFNFTINSPLFLDTDSTITDTAISTVGKFLTKIGKSYGTGAIFIDINDPRGIL